MDEEEPAAAEAELEAGIAGTELEEAVCIAGASTRLEKGRRLVGTGKACAELTTGRISKSPT